MDNLLWVAEENSIYKNIEWVNLSKHWMNEFIKTLNELIYQNIESMNQWINLIATHIRIQIDVF